MDIDLRDLELLEALRLHRTLTAAARCLFVSQPALSQRLTRLESRVGLRLFDRMDRQLVPTAAGRRILRTADVVLEELRSVRRDLAELSGAHGPVVRIAAPCASEKAQMWLPRVLDRFRDHLDGIEIRVETVTDIPVLPALEEGLVDVALVIHLDSSFTQLRLTPLYDDELRAVVSLDHPWARRPHIVSADFSTAHLMLSSQFDRKRYPAAQLPLPPDAAPGRVTVLPGPPDDVLDVVEVSDAVTVIPAWISGLIGDRPVVSVQIGAIPLRRTWYAATRHCEQSGAVTTLVSRLSELLAATSARS